MNLTAHIGTITNGKIDYYIFSTSVPEDYICIYIKRHNSFFHLYAHDIKTLSRLSAITKSSKEFDQQYPSLLSDTVSQLNIENNKELEDKDMVMFMNLLNREKNLNIILE